MQWFQNAFTRRLNARRHLWGHLYGGRYKAIPIEDAATSPRGSVVWRDYLRAVIDYVHLNLKSAANASQQIRRFHQVPDKELPREVRAWKMSRNVA